MSSISFIIFQKYFFTFDDEYGDELSMNCRNENFDLNRPHQKPPKRKSDIVKIIEKVLGQFGIKEDFLKLS